jgi:hypothetical protein
LQLISNQYFIDILNTLTLNVIVDRNDAIISNGAEEVVNNGEGRSNHDMARSYFQEVQKKSL